MRVSVQFTNGQQTLDLYWLEHKGTDIYSGPIIPNVNMKFSYHESGEFHAAFQGRREYEEWKMPLSEFKGHHQLGGIGFLNSSELFGEKIALKRYSGRPSDSILIVDSRSFPTDCFLNTRIGLVEPERFDLLGNRIMPPEPLRRRVAQILLATNVTPWVWVILEVGGAASSVSAVPPSRVAPAERKASKLSG